MDIVPLLKDFGLPVFLVLYYLIAMLPAQKKSQEKDQDRYDNLVKMIITNQKECAEKMEAALHENSSAINELSTLIERKIK